MDKQSQEQASEIERLKGLLNEKGKSKGSKKPKFSENYSLNKNKDKKKRRRNKSTGRRPQADKEGLVDDIVNIYSPDVEPNQCILHRSQCAWRIIEGRARYVNRQIMRVVFAGEAIAVAEGRSLTITSTTKPKL